MVNCFAHVKVKQQATLYDSAGNILRFQEATICEKCGKIYTQMIQQWDLDLGEFK